MKSTSVEWRAFSSRSNRPMGADRRSRSGLGCLVGRCVPGKEALDAVVAGDRPVDTIRLTG
eukprot:15312581-Alexandrium_andersonii.AAC.1